MLPPIITIYYVKIMKCCDIVGVFELFFVLSDLALAVKRITDKVNQAFRHYERLEKENFEKLILSECRR